MELTMEQLKELLKFGSVAGATGTDPKLLTAKVMLYTNNIAPTVNTVIADLVEATFPGYSRSGTVTWSLPVISNETNLEVIAGDEKTFTVTTNVTPETVFGYALVTTISAVDYLLAVAPAPAPITPVAGSTIRVVPRMGLDDTANNPSGDITLI